MNFKRGFFRLWLAAALLWIVLGGFYAFNATKEALYAFERTAVTSVPVSCDQVRGEAGVDYTRREAHDRLWEQLWCWYDLLSYRNLFPENQHLSDGELSRRLYAATGWPLSEVPSWQSVALSWVPTLLVPPALLLLLGIGIAWVIGGFRRRSA